ncbi:hypothetical protein PKCEKB_PKCEKB_05320, partial [Dysosmobacter welbionis]
TKRQGPPFYRSAGPSVLSWSCCPRAASDKTERGIAVFMRRKNHMAPARIILIGFALLILAGALLLTLPISTRDG